MLLTKITDRTSYKNGISAIDGLTVMVHDTPLPIARERKQVLLDLIIKNK